MNQKELGTSIIAQVAKNNGTSVEKVRNDMQEAISAAYENEETKERWDEIFGKGVKPTPEEFIVRLGQMM